MNAPNFPKMLNRSLDKDFNLLASSNNFPKGMIVGLANLPLKRPNKDKKHLRTLPELSSGY